MSDLTAQETTVFDSKRIHFLLKTQQLPFLPAHKGHGNFDVTDLERSLADHTAVDNMDEDNMFICKDCTDKKGTCTIKPVHIYVCTVSNSLE